MDKGWQVIINPTGFYGPFSIYVFQDWGPNRIQVLYYHPEKAETAEALEFREYEGHEREIPPTLILPFRPATSILSAFVEAITKQGIKPTDEAKREGELVATKYHLEDLRQVLKLKGEGKK